ncbi:MAG: phosphoribosylanthranilate isomerase [Verrucomicrobiales bacterium]
MKPRFVQINRIAVKICGITSQSDALAACDAGADALGFNFWPKSKRFIEPEYFEQWVRELPESTERVGVFVNAEAGEVFRLLETGVIHAAQFHGNETLQYYQRFSANFGTLKAFRVKDDCSVAQISSFPATTVLLDAYCPGEYGGSGACFDWHLGRRFVLENPDRRVVLAGGLKPDNVGIAAAGVLPAAVDVASGVERTPGIKDISRVNDFIAAVREVEIPD